MNKAISTALLLAAGTALANAASVYENITSTASGSLLAAWNFNDNANQTDGTSTWEWNTGFSASDGFATVNSSSRPYKSDSNGIGITADSFTISFDVNSVNFGGSWKTLLALTTDGGSAYNYAITLASGSSSGNTHNLAVFLKPGANAFGGADVSGSIGLATVAESLPADAWTTVTVTMGEGKLTVYLDGKKAGSADFGSDNCVVTGIQFGSTLGGGNTITSANIDNLAIWNTALSASQVAALPEPSAFGLLAGLGALALVAARRRRSRKAA